MDQTAIARIPEERAARAPEGRCVDDPGRRVTNAEFAARVGAAAGHLARLGVGRGDTVAVMLPNRVELVVTMFAAWRLGAACTPLNPALTSDEALYQLADSAAKAVVVDEAGAGRLGAADAVLVPALELGAAGDAAPAPVTRPDDIALLIYTSGTTGRPKGVMLDHANLTAMAGMLVEWFSFTDEDRSLLVLPLFHINGIMVGVVTPLLVGGSAVIAPRFDPEVFWELVEAERPTYTSGVPTLYAMLANLPTGPAPDASSLRFAICGAAPMPPGLIASFEQRYQVPIIEGYGLSETSVACTINPLHGTRKPGTVGLPLPGQRIRITDPTGEILPAGEAGEVQVHGPNVMRGYLGRSDATADSLRDGWLATGDVGYLDRDGYLVLVDRVKDMIIRGGENIYPQEIENVLYRHPAVAEAAVVGRHDDVYGEQPVAVLVLKPDHSLTEGDAIAFCGQRLARYKVPRSVILLDALPRNSVGKVVKGTLRDLVN